MTFSASASLAVNLDIPGLPDDSGLKYELLVFPMPRAQFWVHELTGEEALSELYHFDVTVSTEELLDGIVERALIGQRAILIIRAGKVPRIVRGIVAAITLVRRHPVYNRTQYRIRIVPRLWLLRFGLPTSSHPRDRVTGRSDNFALAPEGAFVRTILSTRTGCGFVSALREQGRSG